MDFGLGIEIVVESHFLFKTGELFPERFNQSVPLLGLILSGETLVIH